MCKALELPGYSWPVANAGFEFFTNLLYPHRALASFPIHSYPSRNIGKRPEAMSVRDFIMNQLDSL